MYSCQIRKHIVTSFLMFDGNLGECSFDVKNMTMPLVHVVMKTGLAAI